MRFSILVFFIITNFSVSAQNDNIYFGKNLSLGDNNEKINYQNLASCFSPHIDYFNIVSENQKNRYDVVSGFLMSDLKSDKNRLENNFKSFQFQEQPKCIQDGFLGAILEVAYLTWFQNKF